MRDTIVPFFASLFLIVGALLFSDGVSTSDLNQTAKVIGGAIFLSLGLVSMWFGVKNWRKIANSVQGVSESTLQAAKRTTSPMRL